MPLKKIEMASNGIRSETATRASASVVNIRLNLTPKINTIVVKIKLITMLFTFTKNSENFATLG